MATPQHATHYTTVKPFVDTNILLYAYDKEAGSRHAAAKALTKALWQQNGGILSTQVLQEFYVNVTRKIPRPLSPVVARNIIRSYCVWHIEQASCESVLYASEIQERHRVSFWDALIIATAVQGGADILLSEDLNAGQIIEGVLIVNPFEDSDSVLRQLCSNQQDI
ncbi:MAG: PIN domain nuclease [Halochromatium sp.]|nr:PIN domain nuclease [Halochromatium sp.]